MKGCDMDKVVGHLKRSIKVMMDVQKKLYKLYFIALGISVAQNAMDKVKSSKNKIRDARKRHSKER